MMSKRIVSGVLCGLLLMAIGCGEPKRPTPPDTCSPVPYKVLVKDGVRYLQVSLPDGNLVIINIDALPAAQKKPAEPAPPAAGSATPTSAAEGSGGPSHFQDELCPCEEPGCIPLCYRLRQLQSPGANLCTK